MITLLLNLLISATPTQNIQIAWDESTDKAFTFGYNVYEQIGSGPWNFLQATTNTKATVSVQPGVLYHFRVTAFNAAHIEGSASNDIGYVQDPSMALDKSGKIVSTVGKSSQLNLLASTDLKVWTSIQNQTTTNDTAQFQVPMNNPKSFYRLQRVLPTAAIPTLARSQLLTSEMPPLPPTTERPKLPLRIRLWLMMKYKPGHHFDPSERFEK